MFTKEISVPSDAKKLINLFKKNNYEIYIVGGAIRNMLLKLSPKDYDLVTSATISEMKTILKDYKIINNNGLKHDTLSVFLNGQVYEISSFKSNEKNIISDLNLRDFTINSFAYNGIELFSTKYSFYDLKNKIIRCNGNAKERFKEDSLRILRALRFAATLNFKIEKSTRKAIFALKNELKKVAIERIREEFIKIILSENASEIIKEYKEIFAIFIPELEKTFGFEQKNKYHFHDVFDHNLSVMNGVECDLETKLAAFFHDIGKPDSVSKEVINGEEIYHFYGHSIVSESITRKVLERLKFSNSTIENVIFLVKYHDFKITNSRKNLKKLLSLMGEKHPELFPKFIDLVSSDRDDHVNLNADEYINYKEQIEQLYISILEENECFNLKKLNLNGYDLYALGIPQGPVYKVILEKVLESVIAGSTPNDRLYLIQLANKIYEEVK